MKAIEGTLPVYVIACVGGGSNSLGVFDTFLDIPEVKLVGVEAGGLGVESGKHAVRFEGGRLGIVEGYKSYWLQDESGQIADTHSISAGLDYAGIGPLHAYLREQGRVTYTKATDSQTLEAFQMLARNEGILAALESSHAVAEAIRLAPTLSKDQKIVVNLSGRGDKDIFIFARHLADENFNQFLRDFIK